MAVGWAWDGAVQDQIDASVADAVERACGELPQGESPLLCSECDKAIPQARREAIPGVRLCVPCQDAQDQTKVVFSSYNRRGNKGSQMR